MTLRLTSTKITLFAGIICYFIGCALFYLFWYKNGQFLHITIILLIVGGAFSILWLFKVRNVLFIPNKSLRDLIVIVGIFTLFGFAGFVNTLEKKRVNSIFRDEPTKQAIATVVTIDLRSTRSGKQPWSIIKYDAKGQVIEQSFADTSKNLVIGQKYLIEYSLKYPDMFRVLRKLE